jgi:uncharacterized protein (DUF433 family)
MAKALTTGTVPLMADADGVMRVSGTRVTLDSLLAAFNEGATAEEIAQQYPSVSLGDVYQVIGYYLGHSSELDTYLCQYRLKIPHSAGRKGCHPPEKMVESFSRLVENETGW